MGFMDKAKKMAEQAQAKLDEAQKQFNAGQQPGQPQPGPAVEYDQHGRPISQPAPPHGDPLAGQPAAQPPAEQPGVPPSAEAAGLDAPPARPSEAAGRQPVARPPAETGSREARGSTDAADEDRNHPGYAPPKLSSGDPLAG
jgi:hypothetical protein